jgi:hypothetical protein
MRFHVRVAMVTGGARGIGAPIRALLPRRRARRDGRLSTRTGRKRSDLRRCAGGGADAPEAMALVPLPRSLDLRRVRGRTKDLGAHELVSQDA